MFNKEQLKIIQTLLLAKHESLTKTLVKNSRQLGPHPRKAITTIIPALAQLKEMLSIIESHLE